jgi:hypothetical protein
LLAKLRELAVAELALIHKKAQGAVGELDPVRAPGEARRAGTNKWN